ncbi:peptidoglycan DD-metalloendopeptidase family protein [Azoarcus olearius]|uniref:Metalloprotease n=1 Tax=Azoarcus sp. (strain BH72) TaxID=418699 RepID=A1K968_AZOSB|nr:peptidoglycan DD-metalloendopeptidase family protein [Azoarcus olearius]CAL95373.1 metalloprotease precursor [Azoarcus olearius]
MLVRKSRILADLPAHLLSRKRSWLVAGVLGSSLLGVVAATAVVPDAPEAIATQAVIERLPKPLASSTAVESDLPFVHDDRVQPGDTVNSIFRRLGIRDDEALAFLLESDDGRNALRQLRAGRSVTATIRSDGVLTSLSLPTGANGDRITLERADEGLRFRTQAAALSTVVEMRSGTIRHSLFATTDAIGLPDSIATKLADLFGTEIDFHTDLRKGDRFGVVYESIYDQGVPVRTGRILAAEFVNQGKRHAVVLYAGASGKEQYYTEDGRSLKQAFLRSPLEFSRVTSGFGRRLHPIHNNWRSHNGVDFGAPTGTPVKATSDGVVEFVGTQRGYGNIIVLRHRGKYDTAYGHLNAFAARLRKGATVEQGDVIGYVGSTGWATGPHLHYEIRVNDVPQDPLKIALPTAEPLSPREVASFKTATAPVLRQLGLLNNNTQMASATQ